MTTHHISKVIIYSALINSSQIVTFCVTHTFLQSARVSEKPTPFYDTDKRPIDEDYFFRPWKVHKEIVEAIKSSAQSDIKFVDIAQNNKEFLHDLFVLAGAKDELIRNTYKSFWSTTHLSALLDCEKYWHNAHERTALLNRIPPVMRGRVEELACHVWSRRFTDLGVDPVLGAPLSLEILQVSLSHIILLLHFTSIFSE